MFRACFAATLGLLLLAAGQARADSPDPAKLKIAAENFDAGNAYRKVNDFERAASSYEAAHEAVPSAKALRYAIKMRSAAGHGARAATLAAQALDRYPSDDELKKVAEETIEKYEPILHKVAVSCASPCILAVGERVVPGEATTRATVYVDPGSAKVSASFFGGSSDSEAVEGTAGGRSSMRFEPANTERASASDPGDTGAGVGGSFEAEPDKTDEKPSGKGLPPAVFVTGVVLTGVLGGVTIWSGVDTVNNPGRQTVIDNCKGLGPTCPEYQDGIRAQTRTNILLGATLGTAAVTGIIGAFFTNWGGSKKAEPAASDALARAGDHGRGSASVSERRGRRSLRAYPTLSIGPIGQAATIGAAGTF